MPLARTPLVSGNWKMHHDHLQAIRTLQDLALRLAQQDLAPVEVSVHPPFTSIRSVQTAIEDRSIPVALGAQDCHHEDQGAFTGAVSPAMLSKLGVVYVIVGHSERRRWFGDTDEEVAAKLRAVLRHGMTPIVCVGEDEGERESGETEQRLEAQVTAALQRLGSEQVGSLVVAYEPIWAIGTGRTATPEDAQTACAYIRRLVVSLAGEEAAGAVRVQYGGSVKPDNAEELVAQADIDGLLVGGASLEAQTFASVVEASARAARRAGRGVR
jgi:triosephosphate isomerase